MINIAIVEDNAQAADALKDCIEKYGGQSGTAFDIVVYDNAAKFLGHADSSDVIFMDIELPDGNGMDIVRKMRSAGNDGIVVFVTNMPQYAVSGYEVDALDFIVKPVTYATFKLKFKRILQKVKSVGAGVRLEIKGKQSIRYIYSDDVLYIEVMNHTLAYHLGSGEVVKCTGILKNVLEQLKDEHFSLCNRCFLVNLKYVKGFDTNYVDVAGEKLVISQPRRKEFLRAVTLYFNR